MFQVYPEFACVRKLVRRACAVEVFAYVFDVAVYACLVETPVERCADGEVLAAPVESENPFIVAVLFFLLLYGFGFAYKRAQ